jgi:Protein of unknown function (DUF2924)
MKRRAPVLNRGTLTAEIAALSKASIEDLRKRWKTLCGEEPSGHIGRSFLNRTIAYRLQERAFGGLKSSTRRLVARVAEKTATGSSPKSLSVRKAEPGTILIREWQGKTHEVTVLGDGMSFKGKRYRSLSEIARNRRHWLVRTAILRATIARAGE